MVPSGEIAREEILSRWAVHELIQSPYVSGVEVDVPILASKMRMFRSS